MGESSSHGKLLKVTNCLTGHWLNDSLPRPVFFCASHPLCFSLHFFRAVKFSAKLMGQAMAKRVKATILFATETGKSQDYAKTLCEIFKHAFDAKVLLLTPCIILSETPTDVSMYRPLIEKQEGFREILPISPSTPTLHLHDEAEQMPAECRRQEGKRRKCVFCHIFFFSHAVKCRGSQARFNHWSVEQCSSLRQDPEAPLAVQICLEKEWQRKKMLNTLLSIIHCVLFLQVISYFSILFSHRDQSYKKRFVHARVWMCVSLRVGVCRWIAGQMQTPGASLGCCGAKACFLFMPLVVRVCWCTCVA